MSVGYYIYVLIVVCCLFQVFVDVAYCVPRFACCSLLPVGCSVVFVAWCAVLVAFCVLCVVCVCCRFLVGVLFVCCVVFVERFGYKRVVLHRGIAGLLVV